MRTRPTLVALLVGAAAVLALVALRAGVPGPPPAFDAETVIVWSPHPDDETFGAAMTIEAQVRAGKRVIAVLLTDGENSGRIGRWIDAEGEDLNEDGAVDRWDFAITRRAEYEKALAALGVSEARFLGRLDSKGATGFEDRALRLEDVEQAIVRVSREAGGRVAHLAPMRYLADDPFRGDFMEHPDHTVLFEALSGVCEREGLEATYFKVYEYEADRSNRQAPLRVRGDEDSMRIKRLATDAYGEAARVSTPEIWDGARSDPLEYLVRQDDL